MTDLLTPENRSRLMGSTRGARNASTELRLIGLLKRARISGWRRNSSLPGRPDFVFPKFRVAVFVDGDFWHGHPTRSRIPKTNTDFWAAKIEGNRRRDRRVDRKLRRRGWSVLRIWESSLSKHPQREIRRIAGKLGERKRGKGGGGRKAGGTGRQGPR